MQASTAKLCLLASIILVATANGYSFPHSEIYSWLLTTPRSIPIARWCLRKLKRGSRCWTSNTENITHQCTTSSPISLLRNSLRLTSAAACPLPTACNATLSDSPLSKSQKRRSSFPLKEPVTSSSTQDSWTVSSTKPSKKVWTGVWLVTPLQFLQLQWSTKAAAAHAGPLQLLLKSRAISWRNTNCGSICQSNRWSTVCLPYSLEMLAAVEAISILWISTQLNSQLLRKSSTPILQFKTHARLQELPLVKPSRSNHTSTSQIVWHLPIPSSILSRLVFAVASIVNGKTTAAVLFPIAIRPSSAGIVCCWWVWR